jgi:tRNA(Ser,Leu) C12 N-acetylase TAN1
MAIGGAAMTDQTHEQAAESARAFERRPGRGPKGLTRDWNVVVSVREGGFNRARKLLRELGAVSPSGFLNLLVMRVDDPKRLLEALAERAAQQPDALDFLGRAVPVSSTFTFQSPAEFEARARDAALAFLPELAGKGFHVRRYRHGFKGRLSSQEEERLLGTALLEALEKAGTPGRVAFEDPDVILAVETLGNRAGLSLWTREELRRYPLLRLD